MNKNKKSEVKTWRDPSTTVTLTRGEYLSLKKEELLTGKSIQTILKENFFSKPLPPPVLSKEKSKQVVKEITTMGRELNDLVRDMHMHKNPETFKSRFEDFGDRLRTLRCFLGLGEPSKKTKGVV